MENYEHGSAGPTYLSGAAGLPHPHASSGMQTVRNQPPLLNDAALDRDLPANAGAGTGGSAGEDEEPELNRGSRGHRYDHFWTDNVPSNQNLEPSQMLATRTGFGCCMGPCCSQRRTADWKRFFTMVTTWTIIINFVMLIVEFGVGGLSGTNFFYGPDTDTLIQLGAKSLAHIYCKGQVFRYITPVFLHAGFLHFAVNAYFAYRVMLAREVYWGRLRTVAMYAVSGVGGSVLSLLMYAKYVSVGASGALCGIFGGFIVDVARMWKRMDRQMRTAHVVVIVLYVVVMAVWGFLDRTVDNGGHLGGLLAGIFLAMIILQKNWRIRMLGGALLVTLFVVPTIVSFTVFPEHYDLSATCP